MDKVPAKSPSSSRGNSRERNSKIGNLPANIQIPCSLGFGIKLTDAPSSSDDSKRGVDKNRHKSPNNRHQIQVYDATATKPSQGSPYLCEVKQQNLITTPYQEIFVSDHEYKLLQSAFNLQPPHPRTQVRKFKKTLFGYVTLPPADESVENSKKPPSILKNSITKSNSKTSLSSRKSVQLSTRDSSKDREIDDLLNNSKGQNDVTIKLPSSQSRTDSTTNTEGNSNEAQRKKSVKLIDTSSSPISKLAAQDETESQTENELEGLHGHRLKIENGISQDNLILNDLMKLKIFSASEMSIVLMNALFGDSLKDPNSSEILTDCDEFQEFINATSEIQALRTAGHIFDMAGKAIANYLTQVDNSTTNDDLKDEDDKVKSCQEFCPENSNPEMGQTTIDLQPQLTDIDTNSDSKDEPKYQMTLTSNPNTGTLMQSIICQDYEFKLNFIGSARKVNALFLSSKSKSHLVTLTPLHLLEMTERSASYTINRITASKYHLLLTYDKLTATIHQCLAGKHGYYSKSMKRAELKLRGLNTFSGIILQISRGLTDMFKKLFTNLEKILQLEEILNCPKIPGFTRPTSRTKLSLTFLTSTSSLQKKDGHQNQLTNFLQDIDNVIEIGKNSLTGIQMKNPQIKMKKNLKEIIKILFEACIQLDDKHHVDLGTLIMSMVCNVNYILKSPDYLQFIPTVDPSIRKQLLISFHKLDNSVLDVYELCKRMSILSSHLATKSLQKLKKNKEAVKVTLDKSKLMPTIPWYRRRVFQRKPERTYSLISVPSPSIEPQSFKWTKELRKVESAGQMSTQKCPVGWSCPLIEKEKVAQEN